VKWLGVRTQYSTTPFVEELYDRINEILDEYEVIICRWPKYICHLEKVCPNMVLHYWAFFCYFIFGFLKFCLLMDYERQDMEDLKINPKLEIACTYMCFGFSFFIKRL